VKLAQLIAQYVAFRKSLGQDFESDRKRLVIFSRFVGESAGIKSVKLSQVAAFLAGRGPITRYWHLKYWTLRGFFRYAITRGYLFTSPLPTTVPKLPARFVPHIYSREELRRLLDGTASYQKHKTRIVMEPHTFRAILLLLYGAALRVSEALSLNLADVDLEEAVIVIRDTKFYKTRLVPLGSDLNAAMTKYAKQRKRDKHSQGNNAPFFVTKLGARISSRLLRHAFQRLRTHSGVHRQDRPQCQPRLHDLRHAAAVHRLTAWYREGKDVQRLLPLLSTYLGHVDIASTQLYLTMTPELLHEASQRFAQYVFGEVSHA
jgi:site-specific recombinase XerD